jgi:hypothetical protein
MSKWDIPKPETNSFWETDNQRVYEEYRLKSYQLLLDLDAGKDDSPLVDWYLERYFPRFGGITFERALWYMNGETVGNKVLERAGITPLTVAQQVAYYQNPQEFAAYVAEAQIKFTAWQKSRRDAAPVQPDQL